MKHTIEIKARRTEKIIYTSNIYAPDNITTARKLGLAVEQAVRRGVDLRGANLRGVNLVGLNLEGAYLIYADLKGANLAGAYLRDADLRDANLRDANLTKARLTNAYLRGANLTNATLRGAILIGANLRDVDLTNAYLTNADLRGASLEGAKLKDANLKDAYLEDADLRGANLEGANLEGVKLIKANLEGINMGNITIPIINNIHQTVYNAASRPNALNMCVWHSTCGTAHCRAGWVVTLAGAEGLALEASTSTAIAAYLIYRKSDPDMKKSIDFYADNEKALKDMKKLADKEALTKSVKEKQST